VWEKTITNPCPGVLSGNCAELSASDDNIWYLAYFVTEGDPVTISAAPSARHFSVSNAAYTLTLKWLKLTGGGVSGSSSNGGSILMSAAGTIHATLCWFHDNKAIYGGSIHAPHVSGPTITSGSHTGFEFLSVVDDRRVVNKLISCSLFAKMFIN
jgi:hypothetical protein